MHVIHTQFGCKNVEESNYQLWFLGTLRFWYCLISNVYQLVLYKDILQDKNLELKGPITNCYFLVLSGLGIASLVRHISLYCTEISRKIKICQNKNLEWNLYIYKEFKFWFQIFISRDIPIQYMLIPITNEAIPIPQSARKLPLVIRPKRFSKKGQRVRNELNLKDFFPSLFKGQTYKTFYTYRNDISIKSSNVKLNINNVCNLIKLGKRAI